MRKAFLFVAGAGLALAACSESPVQYSSEQASALAAAYGSVIPGFTSNYSSYLGGDSTFLPGQMGRHQGGGMGMHGSAMGSGMGMHGSGMGMRGPGMGMLMGGGLGDPFLGKGFGAGFGGGRHGDASLPATCAFEAASGRVVCPVETRNGLTVQRSAAYADASGVVQQAFDSATTNTINLRSSVSGTLTRRDGSTSTVQSASDRTVAGLRTASRTVNGTSAGTETTSAADTAGTFTVARVMGDTIQGVVIPVPTAAGERPYPTAGTVIRSMQVTLTRAGASPVTSSRREVVTYDGSATAKVVITQDGTTKTCTLPLPHGRPSCN